MAPKYHPTPLFGGDRRALQKELGKARAMTTVFAQQAEEFRAKGEALIRKADKLSCESWNERMWTDGEPIDQAVNGGFPDYRSSTPAAGHRTRSISPPCPIRRRRSSMISPAASAAENVPNSGGAQERRCSS